MITVKSIMTKNVATISQESTIHDAAKQIIGKSVSSLVVMDNNKPIAVVSEKDIIQGLVSKKMRVKSVMDREFLVISPSTRFSEINKNVKERKIKRFPVVENENLIGLVTEMDIVQATRDFTRFHEIVQEVILAVFGLATTFFLFYFSPLGSYIFR